MRWQTAEIGLTRFSADVYEPSDDSFALVDALVERLPRWTEVKPTLVVEIGSGTGYVISTVALLLRQVGCGAHVIATDINPAALEASAATLAAHKVSDVELVQADLLEPLRDRLKGKVDLLVFNPPYVPTPDEEVLRGGIAAAWAGGYAGRVVIDRLLPQVGELLSGSGHFFMVTVFENRPEEILHLLAEQGLSGDIALQRSADEERLSILHCWRKNPSNV